MIRRHAVADNLLAWTQIATTPGPIALLWWVAASGIGDSWATIAAVTILLSLFTLRVLVLMHECGHGTFLEGTGRLEPGDIAVTSGQTVITPILTASIRYKLTVTDGSETATRNLDLAVKYRERFRTIACGGRLASSNPAVPTDPNLTPGKFVP